MGFSIQHAGCKTTIPFTSFFLCLLGSALAGCSVTQPVRVLPEGTTDAVCSAGGPFLRFNGVLAPVPYVNAGIMHGYSDNVTLTADVHATMAILKDAAFDVGAATRLLREKDWTPEVTLKGQLYCFSDLVSINNARLFPLLTINASRDLGGSTLLYLGADQLLQFNKPNYFVSPFAGVQFPLTDRWAMQTEFKWMAANMYTAHGALRGVSSIHGDGGIALFFGFTWRTSR